MFGRRPTDEMQMKRWLQDDEERVVLELTSLMKYLDVRVGDIQSLRHAVDTLIENNKQRV